MIQPGDKVTPVLPAYEGRSYEVLSVCGAGMYVEIERDEWLPITLVLAA